VPTFYEFFAGGGMARAGLGNQWSCLFANDIDIRKGAAYEANWGSEILAIRDVAALSTSDIPVEADLAWASFPCQDLSLAGAGAGLKGERSGTFWNFWHLLTGLDKEHRAPKIVVLENVCGALRSHDGQDFASIGAALVKGGYEFGALVIDAAHFVPQSRPRLFVVGVKNASTIPDLLTIQAPDVMWHPHHLVHAYGKLPQKLRDAWRWWRLPVPPRRRYIFSDLIEDEPEGVAWHSPAETKYLLSMMSPLNLRKVERAKQVGYRMVGGVYRRTRADENGDRVQRAEVRFDDISGCLRTPVGGSSRQTILFVEGAKVLSRLLSPREAARLMGLPDSYVLPKNYNEAYHLAGDGVVVPVVRFLAEHLLEPIVVSQNRKMQAA